MAAMCSTLMKIRLALCKALKSSVFFDLPDLSFTDFSQPKIFGDAHERFHGGPVHGKGDPIVQSVLNERNPCYGVAAPGKHHELIRRFLRRHKRLFRASSLRPAPQSGCNRAFIEYIRPRGCTRCMTELLLKVFSREFNRVRA